MENINPTLGFNFRTEAIMKIVRIIHFCLRPNRVGQPKDVLQTRMSYVIDEINGALQLEEGLNAEGGAMMIDVLQMKLWKRRRGGQYSMKSPPLIVQ
jgi:hypothetical protein